jgi:hypothetical protein
VEDLVEGDEVATASGAARPAIWIGSRRIAPRAHPRPWEVNPIRIRAGAFGEGAPVRDLMLSPGHAVFVDGVLVPAGNLVNGATIVQEEVESVRYFHVELDAHDVLLAEGLACESYLDDGNREVFANGAAHTVLYGRLDPEEREAACAPVLRDWNSDGDALAAIQGRLIERAETLGWVRSAEPQLRLEVDGAVLAPLHAANGRAWFQLPAGGRVRLLSNAGRPMDLIPGHRDSRRLGVAVAELRVDGAALDLAGDAFGLGFCEVERHGDAAWRWTDGEATLALAGPALVEIALHMTAAHWRRPVGQRLRLVAG